MKWDQIERKWAAMTRRVQCEWTPRIEGDRSHAEDAVLPKPTVVPPVARRPADTRSAAARPVSGAPTAD